MKRLVAVIAAVVPLLVLQAPAQASPSTYCTDNSPGGEVPVVLVDTSGYFLAAVVWPFPNNQLVGVCFRIPSVAGGIVLVEAFDGTSASTSSVSATAVANLNCQADGGYPNTLNCANQLGGAGITVSNPVTNSLTTGSGPPCVIGGVCVPTVGGHIGLTGSTSSVTVYLPLGGSTSLPITFPISTCIVNFSGPC